MARPEDIREADAMNRNAGTRSRAFWVILAAFAALILFFSTNVYLLRPYLKEEVSYLRSLIEEINMWLPWALLTPLIMKVGRRYSLTRLRWYQFVPVHIGSALVFSGLATAADFGFFQLTARLGITRQYPLSYIFSKGFHYEVLTYAWILTVIYIVDFYRKYRDRETVAAQLESKLAQANLQMLKMQVHPHFLYNTLHAISALVYDDPEAADRMIIRLSELLRLTLEHKGDQEVAVHEEMEFLKLYLEIMKTRFAERLRVSLDVDPDAEIGLIPAFLLQPLVENAIRHGILPRKGGGRVTVRVRRNKTALAMEVEDDGPGFAAEGISILQKGFGLGNTEERLRCLYGADQRLILKNSSTGGALVRVEIPFHTEARRDAAKPEETRA
jgi:sensor histidine kinase YesM